MTSNSLAMDYGAPPLAARYRAVFWEPVPGTGERRPDLLPTGEGAAADFGD